MIELVKKLMNTPSVSGREEAIRDVIIKEVTPYADTVEVDNLGNIIARKKGNGKKIMLCAHMDEIGFFVTFIDKNGFIRVGSVGGIDTVASAFCEVVSEKGVCGVLVPEKSGEAPKLENMYIDIGAKNQKQAEGKVQIGDFFVVKPSFKKLMNKRYIGRPFDDRIGCAIMIEALKKVDSTNDLYFVFSTQEEVGSRGAKPATYSIMPDVGIAFDVTGESSKPGSKPMEVKMGKGCTIKLKDASVICSPEIVKKMREICEEKKIKYQNELLLYGGTDTSVMQTAGRGSQVGAISIPSAYIHTGCEMIDMGDVEEAVKLAVALANQL